MIKQLLGHLNTVFHHKTLVFKYCRKVGIPVLGFFHDMSKFSYTELVGSAKYYVDGKRSPTVGERKDKGYSAVWLHHKGRNKHHFEYWIEFNWQGEFIHVAEMPIKYVKEMFCDRISATKTYLKDRYTDRAPLEYYLAKNERPYLHDNTALILEKALLLLATDGEKSAITYLKNLK